MHTCGDDGSLPQYNYRLLVRTNNPFPNNPQHQYYLALKACFKHNTLLLYGNIIPAMHNNLQMLFLIFF